LTSAPVVDSDGRLLGRITIDYFVDLMKDTAGKNLLAPAGLDDEDDIFAPVLYTARRRALWLGINLITAVIASMVIGIFEATIEKLVALAVLMPIIASMGGNAGTQTLTTVIRGLGVGTISTANALDVLKKELLVGGLNGLIWATVVAVVSIVWYQNYLLATIVATAMLVNIVVSALSGVLLPVMLEKVGIDPALAGGVSLTTITDVVGFLAILGIAALVLV
ncbi:MAG: magnesium transporter, partial [Gammaproteobacteria bacterium]|nr:magnesium transporter [Gammaproteobacteria bacterium]